MTTIRVTPLRDPMLTPAFRGEWRFLSNFHPSPVFGYPSVENWFQAAKLADRSDRTPFRSCSPAEAKRLGRRSELRSDWADVQMEVMRVGLVAKFHDHPHLAELLIRTGDQQIVERNLWHDNFWGWCECQRCEATPGQNHLGRLLMEVRESYHRPL